MSAKKSSAMSLPRAAHNLSNYFLEFCCVLSFRKLTCVLDQCVMCFSIWKARMISVFACRSLFIREGSLLTSWRTAQPDGWYQPHGSDENRRSGRQSNLPEFRLPGRGRLEFGPGQCVVRVFTIHAIHGNNIVSSVYQLILISGSIYRAN